jgi:hypothetical protein
VSNSGISILLEIQNSDPEGQRVAVAKPAATSLLRAPVERMYYSSDGLASTVGAFEPGREMVRCRVVVVVVGMVEVETAVTVEEKGVRRDQRR